VYDKKVRRRRAVLGLLVGLSLILLTAYFGESVGGPFHSVQRGVVQVLSPIQEGASRALKPVRDLAGWFSDTVNAKKQRDQLKKQVATLRQEVAGAQQAQAENKQLQAIVSLDKTDSISSYQPHTARVIGRSPTIWYSQIEIDQGTGDGVHVDDPVIDGDGLVGRVKTVTSGTAIVTLVTDHTFGAQAEVLTAGGNADLGTVAPDVGDPSVLLLQNLPGASKVAVNDQVITAGSRSTRLESLFPKGIVIGQVSRVSTDELTGSSHQVRLKPAADLRHLDFVQVLTQPQAGLRAQAGGSGP
jgi:rod shape-determining protein MreC